MPANTARRPSESATVRTAGDVFARLRDFYSKNSHALLREVHDSTGFASQSVDALAMTLWKSKGIELIGHEIKVSRSDWLRELKKPGKSQLIYRHCQRWYLVVGDEAIVKPGELPTTWGLMVPSGSTFRIAVRAPLIVDAMPPSLEFVAAIMRRCTEQSVDEKVLTEVEARIRTELADLHREELNRRDERHRKEVERLQKEKADDREISRAFEEFVGQRILTDGWRREEKWNLVKRALAEERSQHDIDVIENMCHNVLRTIGREAIPALKISAEVSDHPTPEQDPS